MHLAQLAGLIDSEGSIMLLGQGPQRCRAPRVAFGMTDPRPVEAAREAFGGFVRRSGRPSPKQDVFYWNLGGSKAVELLEELRPHLVIERRKSLADLLINDPVIRDTKSRGRGHSKIAHNEEVFRRMQTLNAVRLSAPPDVSEAAPSVEDFAYLAGVLDGRGSVGRRVEVSSTDPELPAWLASRFGGRVYPDYRRELGAGRPVWSWKRSATGCDWAERVAGLMLVPSRADALAALQDFERTPPVSRVSLPHEGDSRYLELRDAGVLRAPAAREAGIPLGRALYLGR